MASRALRLALVAAVAFVSCCSDDVVTQSSPAETAVGQPTALQSDDDEATKAARKFYVAPDGRPDGKGTIERPWDLQTALSQPKKIRPGSVILLRAGTYTGKFNSTLNGEDGAPITIRSYPGEWAVIDGNSTNPSLATNTLKINGNYTTWRDFEVMNSETATRRRRDVINPPDPSTPLRGDGMEVNGHNTTLINLVVHDNDNGIGFWQPATNSEINGCVLFNNGWYSPDRGHGHGIYIQNQTGIKKITDVVSVNNFGHGMKAYAEQGYAVGIQFTGVMAFNNEAPATRGGPGRLGDIFVGTIDHPADQITITNCYLYTPAHTEGAGLSLGYQSPNGSAIVTNNYIAEGCSGIDLATAWQSATITGNTVYVTDPTSSGANSLMNAIEGDVPPAIFSWDNNTYFDMTTANSGIRRDNKFNGAHNPNGGEFLAYTEWKSASGYDAHSSYTASRPTGQVVFIRPNQYQAGRANIAVFNWSLATTVSVNLSSVLQVGQSFEIRNSQDYNGAPVLRGTYTGKRVQIPMTGTAVARPIGYDFTPATTAPEFNVFIVLMLHGSKATAGE
jgi:hypothetical protein